MAEAKRANAKRAPRTKRAERKARRPSTIERSVLVRATPAEVYALWTTPAGLSTWFCSGATVELRPGGRYDLASPDKKLRGEVVAATADERLVFTWGYGEKASATTVSVTLRREEEGTRIHLVESGFADGAEWDAWYLESSEGWAEVLAALVARVEGTRARQRTCTLSERLEASPEETWEAIGSAEGLSRWFASGGSLDGRAYSLQAGPSRIEGTVREREPGRALSFTWQVWPCKKSSLPAPTVVTIALAADAGGGTRVTLVHSGFGDTEEWAGAMEEHAATWRFLLANLRSVVDRGVDRRRTRSIERTVSIAAPPERVWQALTTPAELDRWECKKATFEDERYVFDWGGGLAASGAVLVREPGRRLELGYTVNCGDWSETYVTFELEREGAGCKLTLVHSGFDGDPRWDELYQGHVESWDIDLEELVTLCETGEPGQVLRLAYRGDALEGLVEPGARLRSREEDGEVVLTLAFPRTVDADAVYSRWRSRLASVARGPIQCGSDFNA